MIAPKGKGLQTWSSLYYVIIIFVISLLFSLQAQTQIFITKESGIDSSVFQYVAREILNGAAPYLDTFDHKGPLLYAINVLGLLISERYGLWIVEFVSLFFTFLIIYKISRLICQRVTSIFVLLAAGVTLYPYFEGGNLAEEYAMLFIAGALYIFSDYFLNNKINRLRLFLCGVCFGAVLLLRVNMIAVWIVMCIGVLIQCISLRELKRIWFFLGYFLLGLFASVTPFICWLAIRGALSAFWDNYILFNLVYSSDPDRAGIYAKINAFLVFLNSPKNLIALSVLIVAWLKNKNLLNVLYIGLFFVTLILICISGQTYGHYGMILIPILVISFAYIGKVFEDCWSKNNFSGILIAVCILVYMVCPTWFSIVEDSIFSYQHRGTCMIDSSTLMISSWIQENTSSTDKILVCGNKNAIYNLSNRFSSSYYSYQSPVCYISPSMQETFFEELSNNQPVVIVLPDTFYAYDYMMQFINKCEYEKVQIDGLYDTFLYKRVE